MFLLQNERNNYFGKINKPNKLNFGKNPSKYIQVYLGFSVPQSTQNLFPA